MPLLVAAEYITETIARSVEVDCVFSLTTPLEKRPTSQLAQ
jgi:hypothetical protein